MKTYFKLLKEIFSDNKKYFFASVFLIVIMSILQSLVPLLVKNIIYNVDNTSSKLNLIKGVFIYSIILLILNYMNTKWFKITDLLGKGSLILIRKKIYNSLWNCHYSVYKNFEKNYLKNVVFTDVLSIFGGICLHTLNIFSDLLMIAILLTISFTIDKTTTLFLFFMILLGIILSILFKPIMAKASKSTNLAMKVDNSINNECIDFLDLTKINNLQDYFKSKLINGIQNYIEILIKNDQICVFIQNFMDHYNQIIIMIITGLIILNKGSSGNLAYYFLVTNLIIDKSQRIEMSLYQIMKNFSAYDNVEKLINIEVEEDANKVYLEDINSIIFENVEMSYGENTLFKNLSFELHKGDSVLVKGSNGSGKSTLLKIISGLISNSDGIVYYNGYNSNCICKKSFSDNIIYLGQDELILNENLKDYLSIISNEKIGDIDYEQYLKIVGLSTIEEPIKNNGKDLSGGEKKKILLMKLLFQKYKKSVILIDETEAGLDKDTQEIMDKIEKELLLEKEKYIILKISHGKIKNYELYNKIIDIDIFKY